jgi:orotidine-5'-phosphate decarboxylase
VEKTPILVALDVDTAEDAVRIARELAPHVAGFTVGPGLLNGPGPGVVGAVGRLGPVLADAKLHDVPGRVETAARRLAEYGARWVSVHASGGSAMLEAAAAGVAAGARGEPADLLAVTVLTSLDASQTAAVFGRSPGELVARLARLAAEAGAHGVICAPKELGVVADVAPGLLRVSPGIRVDGSADDHTATPGEALRRGADLLVIGLPIIGVPDPVEAVQRIAACLG